jgi:hypothetical protein
VFNRSVEWGAILGPLGWRSFRAHGNTTHWTRPGKAGGTSATTGHCRTEASGDLLYVFTSSALPFEPCHAYSRFAAYAVAYHGGDFRSAARMLAAGGYGRQRAVVTARFCGRGE